MPKYNKIKVLVVGSSGLLGSKYITKTKNLFDLIQTSSTCIDCIKLDLIDSVNVKNILETYCPNVIVNCSAYTDVDQAEKNKKDVYDLNVKGLQNLIKFSSLDTKIIHISTDYIFNGEKGYYSEESTPDPLNYYGKTKLEAENILKSSKRNFLIFRINCLFDFKGENFFTFVLNNLKKTNEINIVNDQISNPTYAGSLVDVINQSIILDIDGVYNFGSNDILSRYDFATLIAKKYKLDVKLIKSVKTKSLNTNAIRPLKTNLNCNKIKNALDLDIITIASIIDTKINFYE